MRKAIFLFSILALLLGALVVSAQDELSTANWCDEGGLWYIGDGLSLCNTQPDDANNQTMWVCGWVGAQHALGNLTYEMFLAYDATLCSGDLLFTLYPERWTPPPPVCYVGEGGSFWTTGEYFLAADCTGSLLMTFTTIVANSESEAQAICTSGRVAQPRTTPAWPSNLWHCMVAVS
jgi:hypothetical protein